MIVFLPCRAGSQRVPKKNTRAFAGINGGLLQIKLQTLIEINSIERIVISTNDEDVIRISESLQHNKIEIDKRPEHLATSETSTDELIEYVPKIIKENHILWTHVTSPFLSSNTIKKAIQNYHDSNGFDSVMTVNKVQTFLWDKNGPINYEKKIEKWPRTQTLPEYYEINSGLFICSRDNYVKNHDRIGFKPYLLRTEGFESFDIDWPEDFNLAELIYEQHFK